jgi:zinc transport system permease protein
MHDQLTYTIFSGIFVAAASGLVGSFLVLRKMTLLSDALSHIALPGIALGLLLNFDPLLGGLAFLLFGVVLIWNIEIKTKLAIESITGVLFVTALAFGALITPQTDILEAFFGNVEKITLNHAIIQTIISLIVIGVTLKYLKPLILTSIAPELGAAEKISETKMQLVLLTLIAFTIAIGISFVGVLLMSALSIIPAVTARNLSRNFKQFMTMSVVFAVVSLVSGVIIAFFTHTSPGIMTVFVSAFLFTISLVTRRQS